MPPAFVALILFPWRILWLTAPCFMGGITARANSKSSNAKEVLRTVLTVWMKRARLNSDPQVFFMDFNGISPSKNCWRTKIFCESRMVTLLSGPAHLEDIPLNGAVDLAATFPEPRTSESFLSNNSWTSFHNSSLSVFAKGLRTPAYFSWPMELETYLKRKKYLWS